MRKYYFLVGLVIFVVTALIIINTKHKSSFQLMSNESPFSEMVLPILKVDSVLLHGAGHVDYNNKVILVQVVDKELNVYNLAILNDGRNGAYNTVLKNLNIIWDDNYGFIDFEERVPADKSTTDILFNHNEFTKMENNEKALDDIISLLFLFYDSYAGRNKISHQNLTNDN